jgi:hypothetical protein
MTTRVFRSTDAGAPTLTGEVGSAVTLLNKCLVDGYGLTVPAGWTLEYSAENVASFLMGNGKAYLQVDDRGQTSAAKARMGCFLSMSSATAGKNPAICSPNNSTIAQSVILMKSAATGGTARPWVVIADENTVHVLVDQDSSGKYTIFSFGEFTAYGPQVNNVCISGLATSTATADLGGIGMRNSPRLSVTSITGAYTTGWISNTFGYSSVFESVGVPMDTIGNNSLNGALTAVYAIGNGYPWFPDRALYLDLVRIGRVMLSESALNFSGHVRGIYEPMQKFNVISDGNISGVLVKPSAGELAGKTLEFFATSGGGHVLIEVSDTWE